LIADGTRARIYVVTSHALQPALNADLIHDHRITMRDKPGRALESDHISKHTYTPHSDWHIYQKHVFAREICQILIKADTMDEFQSLILIASLKILSEIRKLLPKNVCEKIIIEIGKDLTRLTDKDLKAYLDEIIVW